MRAMHWLWLGPFNLFYNLVLDLRKQLLQAAENLDVSRCKEQLNVKLSEIPAQETSLLLTC